MNWAEKPTSTIKTKDAIILKNPELLCSYSDREFVNTLEIRDGMSVLDVGVFKGRDIRMLWHRFPGNRFVGVDIQPLCINLCRKRNADTTIEFYVASVLSLPFKDKEFDLVYSNGLLSDLDTDEDRRIAISEMRRVAKSYAMCDSDQNLDFIYGD